MRFTHRRSHDSEEGESYYVSMTDMMVGVVFIFIIMLSYFALQYRASTAAVTSAKDQQTTALLQVAGPLQPKTVQIEVNTEKMIVCIPGDALVAGESGGDANRHCFPYSNTVVADEQAQAAQEAMVTQLSTNLGSAPVSNSASAAHGTLNFPASQLFIDGTDQLTAEGQSTATQVAEQVIKALPCYGYGKAGADCKMTGKLMGITVESAVQFDAFTPDGRAIESLAVTRAVAFHDALAKAQPTLGDMMSSGTEIPLLRVAASAQSSGAGKDNNGGTIAIHFQMKK